MTMSSINASNVKTGIGIVTVSQIIYCEIVLDCSNTHHIEETEVTHLCLRQCMQNLQVYDDVFALVFLL
jgi:hypothetical protein